MPAFGKLGQFGCEVRFVDGEFIVPSFEYAGAVLRTGSDNGKDSLREFTQEPSHPGATAASELAAERAAARVA